MGTATAATGTSTARASDTKSTKPEGRADRRAPPRLSPSPAAHGCGDRVRAVEIRASDEDRQRTVAALERHTGAGRLTLDEFAERARVAHDARTLDELAAVVRDLPAADEGAAADSSGAATEDGPRRDLLLLFAIAAATLILLSIFIAVTRH